MRGNIDVRHTSPRYYKSSKKNRFSTCHVLSSKFYQKCVKTYLLEEFRQEVW